MNTHHLAVTRVCSFSLILAVGSMAMVSTTAYAQKKRTNPTSKVYISDVGGDAVIDTGDSFEEVAKRSVYNAQGTVIETKKAEDQTDKGRSFSTMVYSNGTGAFFDSDTRVEVRRFVQEPFTPNRTDMDVEPSISQTQAFISRGVVGLCTSKLVSGSTMNYQTPHGSVNIRGRKVVIETNRDVTKISMLEGESTVRAGAMDTGGHTIRAGEQAIIRPGPPGQPNIIQIARIPQLESPQLDDKVAMACMAKKTVYFEVKEKDPTRDGAGAEGTETTTGADGEGTGPITAFDDAGSNSTSGTEIVAREVVPTNLPTEYTMTPARVETPQPGG